MAGARCLFTAVHRCASRRPRSVTRARGDAVFGWDSSRSAHPALRCASSPREPGGYPVSGGVTGVCVATARGRVRLPRRVSRSTSRFCGGEGNLLTAARVRYTEGDKGGAMGEVRLLLFEEGADAERLERLTGFLREELLQIGVESVTALRASEPPPGARAFDVAAVGGRWSVSPAPPRLCGRSRQPSGSGWPAAVGHRGRYAWNSTVTCWSCPQRRRGTRPG